MSKRYEGQVVQGKRSQAVAAATSTTFDQPTRAIHANATGSLIGTLEGDSAVSAWSVIAGMQYALGFVSIEGTSGVSFNAIF